MFDARTKKKRKKNRKKEKKRKNPAIDHLYPRSPEGK